MCGFQAPYHIEFQPFPRYRRRKLAEKKTDQKKWDIIFGAPFTLNQLRMAASKTNNPPSRKKKQVLFSTIIRKSIIWESPEEGRPAETLTKQYFC